MVSLEAIEFEYLENITLYDFARGGQALYDAFMQIAQYIKPNKILRVKKRLSPILEAVRDDFVDPPEDDFVKPYPNGDDIWEASWADILKIRKAFEQDEPYEVVKTLYKIDDVTLERVKLISFFSVQKWVVEQHEEISKAEHREFKTELTADEKHAGVEELKKFEHAATLDLLADGDLLKHEKLLELPYIVIFRQLCLLRVKEKISKNFAEIFSKKRK